MRFPPPELRAIPHVRPVKLSRIADTLSAARGGAPVSTEHRAAAIRVLAQLAQGKTLGSLERGVLRALAYLFPELPEARRADVIGLLCAQSTPWRALWAVWLETELNERVELARVLARRLSTRAEQSRRFAAHSLPQWLPRHDGEMVDALVDPTNAVGNWLIKDGPAPHELPRGLEASLESGPIAGAVLAAFSSKRQWVERSDAEQLMQWGQDRGEDWVGAVAACLLIRAGGRAKSPADLKVDERANSTRYWALTRLGHPDERKGRWARLPERAREVMEWLLLREQFDQILKNFREHAERERAVFWEGYGVALRDACYIQGATGIAICLMRFGDLLAVEFGSTGNACYFYDASGVPCCVVHGS